MRHAPQERIVWWEVAQAVVEAAQDFAGAQLPTIVRGLYYEGWRLSANPDSERQPADFAARVAAELPPSMGRDALRVTKAVFNLLGKELDPGETAKIIATLPTPLRGLWPAPKSA